MIICIGFIHRKSRVCHYKVHSKSDVLWPDVNRTNVIVFQFRWKIAAHSWQCWMETVRPAVMWTRRMLHNHVAVVYGPLSGMSSNRVISLDLQTGLFHLSFFKCFITYWLLCCLQCFDAVGWAAVKNWVVGWLRGYLSRASCRLAYGPADATATHCLLLQLNPDRFYLSGTGSPG